VRVRFPPRALFPSFTELSFAGSLPPAQISSFWSKFCHLRLKDAPSDDHAEFFPFH